MYLNGKMAALCLAACASQAGAAAAHTQCQAAATHTAYPSHPDTNEVSTRDLLLLGAGVIVLLARRRPEHDTWQD
ncbi:hypothetical protein ACQ4WP_24100 [Janthinobacterium sp. GB4P2]|uniref:hypothetical protein n=1 Tax=Janthinobacterium sp. GB4P2 TaxID=3424189 RepID=UPI003F2878E3